MSMGSSTEYIRIAVGGRGVSADAYALRTLGRGLRVAAYVGSFINIQRKYLHSINFILYLNMNILA